MILDFPQIKVSRKQHQLTLNTFMRDPTCDLLSVTATLRYWS